VTGRLLLAAGLAALLLVLALATAAFIGVQRRRGRLRAEPRRVIRFDGKPFEPVPRDRSKPADFTHLYNLEFARWVETDIDEMVEIDERYVVYIPTDGSVGYAAAEGFDPPACVGSVYSRAEEIRAIPVQALDEPVRRARLLLIAQGVVLALEDNEPEASAALERAERFIHDKLGEVSRFWHLGSTLLFALLLADLGGLAAILARLLLPPPAADVLAPIALLVAIGALGALTSTALRIARFPFSPAAGFSLHALEAGVRVLVGGIGAALVAAAYQIGFLPALTEEVQAVAEHMVWIVGFFGGFSERAVGLLMSDLEGRMGAAPPAAPPASPRPPSPPRPPAAEAARGRAGAETEDPA